MLDYSKFDNYWGFSFEDREASKDKYVLDELKKRQEKLKAKDDAIANLQYERNLVMGDILSVIRYDLAQSGINLFRYLDEGNLFWEAWRYCNHHKDKDFESYKDKEVKKKEKQSYEFVMCQIESRILNNNKEFVRGDEIMDSCFSTYYEFLYKIRGQEIYVCIPNFKNVNEKNYLDLLQGYVIRYRESECCIGWICGDIDYTKIYDKMMQFIDEHWPKMEDEIAK